MLKLDITLKLLKLKLNQNTQEIIILENYLNILLAKIAEMKRLL